MKRNRSIVSLLALVLVAGAFAFLTAAAPARAQAAKPVAPNRTAKTVEPTKVAPIPARGVVAASRCRAYDPNLRNGLCHQFPDGRVTWLGNFTNPKGRVFFCIDKNKDSRLPATAPIRSTANLKNQFGKAIGNKEVAALNYVIDKWAAGAGDTDSAAIALIIREVMSDTSGQFPSGLNVGEEVIAPRGGLPSGVVSRARAMWNQASAYYGPWDLRVSADTTDLKVGQTRTVYANVYSAAGKRVPGVKIDMTYNSRVTGPATVTSSGTKTTTFTIRATKVGTLSIAGAIEGPAGDGRLFDPADNSIQRGWIAERSTDRAALRLEGEVRLGEPVISTATSSKTVEPGVAFHDNVRVTNAPADMSATATAVLYGPYPAQPGAADCLPAQEAGRVTFPVNGPATYPTPDVTVAEIGYYTWVISLPATADTTAVTTPCGIVQETTLVTPPLIKVTLSTQISDQSSIAGDTVNDTIVVTGLEGETITGDLTVEWTLYGPVAPVDDSCTGVNWDGAQELEKGTITVNADGTYSTPDVDLPAAGCYSYGEELLGTTEVAPYSHPVGEVSQTTLTGKNIPKVATQVSDQQVLVGATLFDTIKVEDLLAGQSVNIDWALYGPIDAVDGECAGLGWTDAPVFAEGTISVNSNGEHKTPVTAPIVQRGCYSYGETLQGNDSVTDVEHPVGHPTQTALVDKSWPAVRTEVNDTTVLTGTQLQDNVWVTGLEHGVKVKVDWTLHGPLAPKAGKCEGLDWSKATVVDHGVFNADRNGKYQTRLSKKLVEVGCYTYAESTAETTTAHPHEHAPGHVTQTALVKTPEVPKTPETPQTPASSVPNLPNAGGPSIALLAGGVLLLGGGAVLMLRGRRKTSQG